MKIASLETLKISKHKDNSRTAVILLHGYGANMHDLVGLSSVIPIEGDWYFPNAPHPILGMGRAWFPIDQRALEEAIISGVHRDFRYMHSSDFTKARDAFLEFAAVLASQYQRLIIGGFSQGAMVAAHGALFMSTLELLILFSANLYDEGLFDQSFGSHHQFKVFQSHGRSDQLLSFQGAEYLYEKFSRQRTFFSAFDGGHEIPSTVIADLVKFLGR